ncbi:MAG TPA: P1 family peptidase [Candidatus Baltobacteraceae bacterium]|jgi:D-aminopeptidase|nr:P1 family peptidase [Candidatus Baltobacteraceae bacterium]
MTRCKPPQLWRIVACLLAIAIAPAYAQTLAQGFYRSGPLDGITDVPGVRVAHVTKISGSGALHPGIGPIRTGATVILPNDDIWNKRVSAAMYTLNGNGELTGAHWVEESGFLEVPIVLTDTLDVGRAQDGVVDWMIQRHPQIGAPDDVPLPVVGECDDQLLNDIQGRHIVPADIVAALNRAASGQFDRGAVGAGTGMILFGFKGGIGSASRILDTAQGGYTVGVLVNANNGSQPRRDLVIDGVSIGRKLEHELLPTFPGQRSAQARPNPPDGSIIVAVATNAPLEARQLREIAQRATLGLGRTGLTSNTSSGDFVIALSTTRLVPRESGRPTAAMETDDARLDALFEATAEATQAAVYNVLFSARTMTGAGGATIYGLPVERVHRMLSEGRP